MRNVIQFLGRFVAAVVLSVVCISLISYLLTFILSLFTVTEISLRIGNAVSGFLMFLPPIAVFISCFADQFTIKERVAAAFLAIIHSIWITVAFLAIANMFVVDILKFLGFSDTRFPEQIIYMLAIAALMFAVGFMTLRNLPYTNRTFKLFSGPLPVQIFGILLILVILCQIAVPLLSRAQLMEVITTVDTTMGTTFGNVASQFPSPSEVPMLYSSYGVHIGFILLIMLTIGTYKSSAARNFFLMATAFVLLGIFNYSDENYSQISGMTLTAIGGGYLLQLLAAIIIMIPSARRWLNGPKNETVSDEVAG